MRVRSAVALGLVIVLLVGLGSLSGASPVIAQGEMPEVEPGPAPESPAPPATGPSTAPPAPKPSGPAPAFSPSGAGAGAGTGSGAAAPAPKPTGSSASSLPPLGAVTYENALKDDRVFPAGTCFGQNAKGHYVGEGFRLWAMGRCPLILDESTIGVKAKGVSVGDGEVALDFKLVEGFERATVGLYVRNVNEQVIGVHVHPARGEASMFSLAGGNQTDLAYRANLQSFVHVRDWNRLAMRVSGYNVWALLNDEPVLDAKADYADAGQIIVELVRDGDLDDGQEVAVVFRNLTLTALEGGEPDRAPKGP